jgi:hypothetical protein
VLLRVRTWLHGRNLDIFVNREYTGCSSFLRLCSKLLNLAHGCGYLNWTFNRLPPLTPQNHFSETSGNGRLELFIPRFSFRGAVRIPDWFFHLCFPRAGAWDPLLLNLRCVSLKLSSPRGLIDRPIRQLRCPWIRCGGDFWPETGLGSLWSVLLMRSGLYHAYACQMHNYRRMFVYVSTTSPGETRPLRLFDTLICDLDLDVIRYAGSIIYYVLLRRFFPCDGGSRYQCCAYL